MTKTAVFRERERKRLRIKNNGGHFHELNI